MHRIYKAPTHTQKTYQVYRYSRILHGVVEPVVTLGSENIVLQVVLSF